jgi:hypothetical protein
VDSRPGLCRAFATLPGVTGNRGGTGWAIIGAGAVAVVGVAGATGAALGFGSFAFAWVVHFVLMLWMSAALRALQPRLAGPWYRVRSWEPRWYRRVGVWQFMRLLRVVGWERAMRERRAFDGSRSSLAGLHRDTRMSECGHVVLFVVGALLVVVAVAVRAWSAVAWLSILNVLLHGYPVLLQRAMRHRVERIRQRMPTADYRRTSRRGDSHAET